MTIAPAIAPAVQSLESLLADVSSLLKAHQEAPTNAKIWELLGQSRLALARSIAALPLSKKESTDTAAIEAFWQTLATSGVLDQPSTPEEVKLLQELSVKQWPGLLAAMTLVPAWDWAAAPIFDQVPTWLWATYTRYVFYTPQAFVFPGQVERYAKHYAKRLAELDHWASANRGSSAVRAALTTYLGISNFIPLYFSETSLKKHYELRARLFAAGMGLPKQSDLPAFPRDGRRLRVGFINRHFGMQTETYTSMPTFEHLDPERFEVVTFAHQETGTKIEEYIRSRVTEFNILPAGIDAQVQLLLGANLDVLVFGTNVGAVPNEVMALAMHRLAPLQVVNVSTCTTTGLPEIDLYVSGELTETPAGAQNYTERLGLIPGPAHALGYHIDPQTPTTSWTRASLNVPEDAVLFVTAANYYKIVPEMQEAWAKLLVDVPNSYLLVHPFNPNWSSDYPIKRFCIEFDRVLQLHGVDGKRLIVSTTKFPSRADVKALLSIGSMYLDTFPFAGVNSLLDPLECGIPAVVWEGETMRSRMGSSLLRQIGVDELIATDEKSYHDIVVRLATEPAFHKGVVEKIKAALDRTPLFLDTLAHSEAFGALLETAYDELVNDGRDAFRKNPKALRVEAQYNIETALSDAESAISIGMAEQAWDTLRGVLAVAPAHPQARRLAGKALTALGRADRATTYLLEAIQHIDGDLDLWCELAEALLQSGKGRQAIEAVQTILTQNPRHLEALLILTRAAEMCGQLNELTDVVVQLQEIAPHDSRVAMLASRMATHQAETDQAGLPG